MTTCVEHTTAQNTTQRHRHEWIASTIGAQIAHAAEKVRHRTYHTGAEDHKPALLDHIAIVEAAKEAKVHHHHANHHGHHQMLVALAHALHDAGQQRREAEQPNCAGDAILEILRSKAREKGQEVVGE